MTQFSDSNRILKRAFDLCVAIGGFVLLLPLFVIVSVMLKLESQGPLFSRKLRRGYSEESIWLIRFRTSGAKAKRRGFATSVGLMLRRTGIEKLPQLLNVLRGDVSIVGPRMYAPAQSELVDELIPPCSPMRGVKPGIVSWGEVDSPRGESAGRHHVGRRIEHDFDYVRNWSLWLDVRIILMKLTSGEIRLGPR